MTGIPPSLATALADRYRIDGEIGAGGMATVYRADDLKHHRTVAIKVLHPELAAVIGAERFLTEIRTTANLQHPHILPLFDSGEAAGSLFYVMPLVDGESLRARLDREAQLPVDEAVRICDGVAAALDYAHRQGIVHRDIKPANILLHDGQPLVADFGIALAVTSAGSGRLTETGLSLGTPHYMSPEQAAGDRGVDARSDVYALGCVLYEMLAGSPPFAGATPQAVLAKVLTTSPGRVSAERPTVPAHVDAVIARAMERVPADRFATVASFRAALADEGFRYAGGGASAAAAGAGSESSTQASRGVLLPVALVGSVVLAAVAAGGWWAAASGGGPPPASGFKSLTLERPPSGWEDGDFALSADGTRLAYVDTLGRIALLPLDGGAPRTLAPERGFRITFSPDGRSVAYLNAEADVMVVGDDGGGPTRLGPAYPPYTDFVWANDGHMYQSSPRGPVRISETGGVPERVPHPDSVRLELTQALPDGRLLVEVGREDQGPLVAALDPTSGALEVWESQPESFGVVHAIYRRGYLFWADVQLNLKAARFDPGGAGVVGEPVVLAQQVGRGSALGVAVAVADDGTLVFEQGASASSGLGENLGWIDLDGNIEIIEPDWAEQFGDFDYIALSPEERYAAVQVDQTGVEATAIDPSEIWIVDLERRSAPLRLTFDGRSRMPVWLPDDRIAYLRNREGGGTDILVQPFDRSGPEELMMSLDVYVDLISVTPDGRTFVLDVIDGDGASDIFLVDLDDPTSIRPFVASPFDEFGGVVSPDGRWMAYSSTESGTAQVFLRRYPEGGRPWPISQGEGIYPIWLPDSRSLLYVGPRRMELALLSLSDEVEVPGRGTLFSRDLYEWGYGAAHSDGNRILVTIEPTAEAGSRSLRVFTDIFTELERRLDGG